MSIFLNKDSKVIVQGITGGEGTKHTALMLKAGTKVKKIRLVDGDHNIDCRVDGIGQMGLKSEFVKKA